MPAFPKTTRCLPFGMLHSEGQSKVWEGSLKVPDWGGNFPVRVHGNVHGPTPKQYAETSNLLASASEFKLHAAAAIANFIVSADVLPSGQVLNAQNVWAHLTPWGIEVNLDPGRSQAQASADELAITIGFEVPWVSGVVLQLETTGGRLSDIYTES
jgi:hypothetical protein